MSQAVRQVDREHLVQRFFEMRPVIRRRFENFHGALPDALRSVTVHQFGVLMCLREGATTMSELARETGVGESAASAVADRLARHGLVRRSHDELDRRVVRVELSDEGRRLVEQFQSAACRHTAEGLAVLTDRQLVALVDILETLAEAPQPETNKDAASAGR